MGVFEITIALFILVIMFGLAYMILGGLYDIISQDFAFEPLATAIKIVVAIVVVIAIVQSI